MPTAATAEDKRLQANRTLIDTHDQLIDGFRRKGRALIDEREQWFLGQIEAMRPDNVEEVLAGIPKIPGLMTNRLARLLRQYFIEAMAQSAQAAWEEMEAIAQRSLRSHGLMDSLKALAKQIGGTFMQGLHKLVVQAEAYARRLAKDEDTMLLLDMTPIVRSGFENGQTKQQVVAQVRDKFDEWRHSRLDTIAETEITKAANKARVALFRSSGQVQKLQFIAILDKRTTTICRSRHLKVMDLHDPRLRANTPPLHFRCRSILSPVFAFEGLESNWSDELPEPAPGFGGKPGVPRKSQSVVPGGSMGAGGQGGGGAGKPPSGGGVSRYPEEPAKSLEEYLGNPSRQLPPAISVDEMIDLAVKSYDRSPTDSKGATINRYFGDIIEEDLYVVALLEHSDRFRGEITPEVLRHYVRRKNDVLNDPEHSLGLYYSNETGWTYFDIVVARKDRQEAIDIGNANRQESIFHLKRRERVDLGGPGA